MHVQTFPPVSACSWSEKCLAFHKNMSSLYSGNPRHVLEEELQETIVTTTVYLSSEYKV